LPTIGTNGPLGALAAALLARRLLRPVGDLRDADAQRERIARDALRRERRRGEHDGDREKRERGEDSAVRSHARHANHPLSLMRGPPAAVESGTRAGEAERQRARAFEINTVKTARYRMCDRCHTSFACN
jgi:hypothetical protein